MGSYDPNYIYKPSLFIIGTKVVIKDKEEKILLLKRSEKNHLSDLWSLPGGGIEGNEDPKDCALRETEGN